MPTLLWFRHDLRLADNPALSAAIDLGEPVIPIFLWEPDEEQPWPPGAASCWWLHHSLTSLQKSLNALGSQLIIRSGPILPSLLKLIKETGARRIFWNRRYEPAVIRRDSNIKPALKDLGIAVESFNGSLLHEPMQVHTKEGKPYQVFTPYWNAYQQLPAPRTPLPAPTHVPAPAAWPASHSLDKLQLLPRILWDSGLRETWIPGEAAAQQSLDHFCRNALNHYADQRDFPGIAGTSLISPHLHFGELSPQQIWDAVVKQRNKADETTLTQITTFQKELVWREFAHHLLFHFPYTTDQPLRPSFRNFPWRKNQKKIQAWQRGQTGYPIVDAGMRQLWSTGWMHNRVRMIVASFLVKHLLQPWQEGAKWFWDTLVDADLANNTLGWQWTAGCGADAAPFFRIFNPMQQSQRFDPSGHYLRRWLPELNNLDDDFIHAPWIAPHTTLVSANIDLGKTYPHPIVDHSQARQAALAAFSHTRNV